MLNVEYRKVDAPISCPRNPRAHSRAQVAKIAASIAELGWTSPVLVDGANGLVASHGRLAGEEATTAGQTDEAPVPEAPETPVSRLGDAWQARASPAVESVARRISMTAVAAASRGEDESSKEWNGSLGAVDLPG